MHSVRDLGAIVSIVVVSSLSFAAPAMAAPPSACTVVTKSAASAAIGTPIVSAQSRPMGPSDNCTLHGTKVFHDVVITTFGWSSVSEAQSAFHAMIAQTSQMMHPSLALHGLGDEAQQIGTSVYVRKGTAGYVFNVIDGSTGQAKAAKAIALAKTASVFHH